MKLLWAEDHEHLILIAETHSEVAFCDIFTADLTSHRYETTEVSERIVGAKYTIIPEGTGVCPNCSPNWLDSFAKFMMNEERARRGLAPLE